MSGCLLMIEDNPADAFLVEQALAEAGRGCLVRTVFDGEDALAYVDRRHPYEDAPRPCLVVVDLNLPRRSGFDVLDELRARSLDVPLLVLTSSGRASDRQRALDHGADEFLRKPRDVRDLIDLGERLARWLPH